MIIDREFDLVEEYILEDENIKCACGSGAIELGEMVKDLGNTFICNLECWDCDNKWAIKVILRPLVEVVVEDVFIVEDVFGPAEE